MTVAIFRRSQVWRPALVNATKTDHLRITGEGTIQGGGKPFWDRFPDRRRAHEKLSKESKQKPKMLA